MGTKERLSPKRLQHYVGTDEPPSLSSQLLSSENDPGPIAFGPSRPSFNDFSYGHTSALDAKPALQPRNHLAKRRKTCNCHDCSEPGKIIHDVQPHTSVGMDEPKAASSCPNDGSLPVDSRWVNTNVFILPGTFFELPKRVADLFCGICADGSDPSDGYYQMPQVRDTCPNGHDLTTPYHAEKMPFGSCDTTNSASNTFYPASADSFAQQVAGQGGYNSFWQDRFPNRALDVPPLLSQGQNWSLSFNDTSFAVPSGLDNHAPVTTTRSLGALRPPNVEFDPFVADSTYTPLMMEQPRPVSDQEAEREESVRSADELQTFRRHVWTRPATVQRGSFNIPLPAARGGKRGAFRDPQQRKDTAKTRKLGSCIRCRMQRIRCEHNPDDPSGGCLTCKRLSTLTAARFPCLRYKITDIRMYKPGQVPGYEWTRRWSNNISEPIQHWASSQVRTIRVSAGYSDKSMELQVRRFVPREGDKLERTWDFNGTKRSAKVPPFALTSLDAGKDAYLRHIHEATSDSIRYIASRAGGLIRMTYVQAFQVYQDSSIPREWCELLDVTFRLWTAIRLSTTSGFIVGEERLGMPIDILDSTSPTPGRIPFPPVLGAQLDLVLIHHIQNKLRRDVLEQLQRLILKNKQSGWFVVYLVSFILLHNASLIIAHDQSYATKHGMKRRFAREDKVKEYYLGANIVLAHFHYCNKGWYPFATEYNDQDLRNLAELDDKKIQFVRETRKLVAKQRKDWQKLQGEGAWSDDYFFISQLYEKNWYPQTIS